MSKLGEFFILNFGLCWKAWVLLQLWGWYGYAPYPLTFLQCVGIFLMVALLRFKAREKKTTKVMTEQLVLDMFGMPLAGLFLGWAYQWGAKFV